MPISKECPCEECILIAMCRYKPYMKLFHDCELISDYIPGQTNRYERSASRITKVEEALNPTKWWLQKHHGIPLIKWK
jgi:hypothetical protein